MVGVSVMPGLAGCVAKPLRGVAWVNFVNRSCEDIIEKRGETLDVFLKACVFS